MSERKAFFNWSGGKDSMLAYHQLMVNPQMKIDCFATSVSSEFNRISMHGVRASLLHKQVAQLGQKLYEIRLPSMPDMQVYDEEMNRHFQIFKDRGYTHAIYGDIFLEDLRLYREQKLVSHGLTGVFPLWKRNSVDLIHEFIDLGYRTIVVCAKEELSEFCGRIIDRQFLADLPADVDPCGENGEFHTFVFDGPLFNEPVKFTLGEKIVRSFAAPQSSKDSCEPTSKVTAGFCYVDLIAD
ncbi:MAG: ATP-binding protein [Pedobacter sp.]|nr:MAG: ATP-binding protein [Pedobacter sp.]